MSVSTLTMEQRNCRTPQKECPELVTNGKLGIRDRIEGQVSIGVIELAVAP
ncbi:MAG: hypothetical protein H0T78_07170 [Longispora sp.]|nr:hypothetical protein [Longispora sp. (in: high G+C Gram-positive bacteria)]